MPSSLPPDRPPRRRPTLGHIAVFAGTAGVFAVLAGWVAVCGSFPGDRRALVALHDAIGTRLDGVMVAIGTVTDAGPLIALAVVVVVVLVRAGRRDDALAFVLVVVVPAIVNPLLKELFARPRPDIRPHPSAVSSHSFPSGHAASTLAFTGAFALIARRRSTRLAIVVVGALLVVLVGFSRLATTVHYPSDLIAGWAWVGAWLVVVWSSRTPRGRDVAA